MRYLRSTCKDVGSARRQMYRPVVRGPGHDEQVEGEMMGRRWTRKRSVTRVSQSQRRVSPCSCRACFQPSFITITYTWSNIPRASQVGSFTVGCIHFRAATSSTARLPSYHRTHQFRSSRESTYVHCSRRFLRLLKRLCRV